MASERPSDFFTAAGWVCLFCLAFPFFSYSQNTQAFHAKVLNLLRPEANTFLFLELSSALGEVGPEGFLETDISVDIGFRLRGERAFVLERRLKDPMRSDFLSSTNVFFREYSFQLPPGSYEVVVDLRDERHQKSHLLTLDYDCGDLASGGLSDIMLLREMDGILLPEIVVGEEIGGISDRIRFRAEVYGEASEVLAARAVLYRQVPQSRGADDGEGMQVLQYTSVVQLNELLRLEKGRATFSDGIDLFELDAGRYLFEIFLYRDDTLVSEKNIRFELPWKRMREIFSNLDTSLAMMVHVAVPEVIAGLRGVEDEDEKLRRFLAFWDARAEPGLETGAEVLERYFFRIFHANEFFPEDRPGWQTERGRIFALYGQPDGQQALVHGGRKYELWSYDAWNMRFVFAEAGKRWDLVYPKRLAEK